MNWAFGRTEGSDIFVLGVPLFGFVGPVLVICVSLFGLLDWRTVPVVFSGMGVSPSVPVLAAKKPFTAAIGVKRRWRLISVSLDSPPVLPALVASDLLLLELAVLKSSILRFKSEEKSEESGMCTRASSVALAAELQHVLFNFFICWASIGLFDSADGVSAEMSFAPW